MDIKFPSGGSVSLSEATGVLPVANGGTGVTVSTGTGATVLSTSPTLVTPNIGVATSTSLTVNDNTTLGSSNSDTVNFNARVASDINPATDNTYDLGVTGHEWRNLNIDGTANIDSLVADTADIDGGTIDGTTVGATTPSTGAFTTLSATGANAFFSNTGVSASGKWIDLANTAGVAQVGVLSTGQAFLYGSQDTWIYADGAVVSTLSSTGLAVTGEITATGNITAYYSDDRLKTKLGNIENALDKVCSLDGFYYEANETAQALGYTPVREVGLSAQSVQKVLPEVIAPAPIDPQYLTMHYERVVPLLVEAIKELKAEIELLKK